MHLIKTVVVDVHTIPIGGLKHSDESTQHDHNSDEAVDEYYRSANHVSMPKTALTNDFS